MKLLADYFYEAINKAVGDAYPMVKEAGSDILRMRVTITDLVPNKPAASVTTLVVLFLWVGDAGSGVVKGDAGSAVFTGEAPIEMEALDSISSKQLAAHIETETGKKYNYSQGVAKGVKSYLDAYSKWDYTKQGHGQLGASTTSTTRRGAWHNGQAIGCNAVILLTRRLNAFLIAVYPA